MEEGYVQKAGKKMSGFWKVLCFALRNLLRAFILKSQYYD